VFPQHDLPILLVRSSAQPRTCSGQTAMRVNIPIPSTPNDMRSDGLLDNLVSPENFFPLFVPSPAVPLTVTPASTHGIFPPSLSYDVSPRYHRPAFLHRAELFGEAALLRPDRPGVPIFSLSCRQL